MIKKTLLAAVAAMFVVGPALAGQCPVDMKKIDAALSNNPQLTAEQLAEVQSLRAEGEAQHGSGAHGDSVATLAKAKALLGIE